MRTSLHLHKLWKVNNPAVFVKRTVVYACAWATNCICEYVHVCQYEHACHYVHLCHCVSRVRRWVCACIQHLPAANEWRPTSPAGLAVLGYGAGAGCFLMVITHFVPGWIILHWHCLGPRGEPHKVDPASQRATKTQMQQQHPTPGLRSSTRTRMRRHTQMHACTELDTQPPAHSLVILNFTREAWGH